MDKTVVANKLLDYNGKGFTNAVRSFFVEDVPVTQGFTNALTDDARVVRCYNIKLRIIKEVSCIHCQLKLLCPKASTFLISLESISLPNYLPIHFPVVS